MICDKQNISGACTEDALTLEIAVYTVRSELTLNMCCVGYDSVPDVVHVYKYPWNEKVSTCRAAESH